MDWNHIFEIAIGIFLGLTGTGIVFEVYSWIDDKISDWYTNRKRRKDDEARIRKYSTQN